MPYNTYPLEEEERPSIFGGTRQRVGGMFGDARRMAGGAQKMLSPYSNRLMMAGMGMLSGSTPQEGFGNAMKGIAAGAGMDYESADRKQEAADKKELDDALAGLMGDQSGPMAGLSGPMTDLMRADPAFARSAILQRMQPQESAEYGFTNVDGTLMRTNKRDGSAESVYQSPNVGQADAPKITAITALRKDFENQPGISRYRQTVPIIGSMTQAISDPSAMADMDFIYGMAQVFDPDSVVRETEMGFVVDSQSMPASVKGQLEKILNGKARLGPQVRQDLVAAARRRVDQYRTQAESETEQFKGIAERNKINLEDVIRPLDEMPEMAAPSPPPAPNVPQITTPEEYEALPSGSEFIAPDGSRRRKP